MYELARANARYARVHTHAQAVSYRCARVVSGSGMQEHRLQQGSKPIFHLEAFVAKVMAVYKQHLIDLSS